MDDDTALAVIDSVETTSSIPEDKLLVASNPAQMVQAQTHLVEWFGNKLREVKVELNEVSTALEVAQKNKWGTNALRNQVTRIKSRRIFYEKALAAVKAGYTLIPEFPIDLFAVRLDKKHPARNLSRGNYNSETFQKPQHLPEGDGRYVSDEARREYSHTSQEKRNDQLVNVSYFENIDFKDVVFPLIAMKAEVMDATAQAMAHKIFDGIGLCPQSSKKDPMIIGRILGQKVGYQQDSLNFLICWFIDLKEL